MNKHELISSGLPRHRAALAVVAVLVLGACTTPALEVQQDEGELYGLGSVATRWPNGIVPVCWQNENDHPELQARARVILKAMWSRAANITFNFGSCASLPANHVTVVFSTVPGFRGNASGLGYGARTVTLLGDDTGALTHFRYEVIHEFGHALGFAHEMKRPDNWDGDVAKQCGVAVTDPDYGNYAALPGGINLTATYDANSVMNYCNPLGFPTVLSAGDIAGARRADAYGPPAPARTSDILWRNVTTGEVTEWIMANGTVLGSEIHLYTEPGEWQIQGAGDFNGDGTSDILWRNVNTGEVTEWIMANGTVLGSEIHLYTEPGEWQIQGIGDFNGDGTSDILWHNVNTGEFTEWIMVNGTVLGSEIHLYTEPAQWHVQGIGDLNGDGTSDILWRNVITGEVTEWIMANGMVAGTELHLPTRPLAWQIQGIGDFNSDGTSDILWHNVNTGQFEEWILANGTRGSQIPLFTEPAEWHVQGIGDFNGDGTSDVLWRNVNTGEFTEWIMANGTVVGPEIHLYTEPAEWQVQGIGDFNGR